MAKLKQLTENGQNILPITHEDAVFNSNGVSIGQRFNAHLENHPNSSSDDYVYFEQIITMMERIIEILENGSGGGDNPNTVHVSNITLDRANYSFNVGEVIQLNATVYPTNATNKSITWTSSNPSKAVVDSNGLVIAIGLGTVTITATTVDGRKTANCVLTISEPYVDVSSISLNRVNEGMLVGDTLQLNTTISPSNATNKNVAWSSNRTSVASVNSNGLVTANGIGLATITVTTEDGNKTAICSVTVSESSSGDINILPIQL